MSTLHRFWLLTALRWVPTGLILPVVTLLPLERGLSLGQLGAVFAVQGVVVLALELPTGGFADSLGRRPLVLASAVVALAAYVTFALAANPAWFVVAVAMTGVFRALDSGPLNAWFVDRVHQERPDDPTVVTRGLAGGSVVIGVSLATGSLLSAALIAWVPLDRTLVLAAPYWAAAGVVVVQLVTTWRLMDEQQDTSSPGLLVSVRQTPRTIVEGARLLRRSRVLAALVAVELFWGFGMVGFEVYMPVRLSDLLADRAQAAAVLGPVLAAAWLCSAAGAFVVPRLAGRWGVIPVSVALRLVQGATVVAMGLAFGPIGLVIAFLATYAVHSASGVLHESLLHEQVDSSHRATVLSLASMAAHPAASVGSITLGMTAAAQGSGAALVLAGVVLALAAPLFLVRSGSDERGDVGDGLEHLGGTEREALHGAGRGGAGEYQEGAQARLQP